MLRPKKTEGFHSDSHKEVTVDFIGLLAHALEMGLNKTEWEQMRMGEYCDLFDAYKTIHNMRVQKHIYSLPEERVSMRDL